VLELGFGLGWVRGVSIRLHMLLVHYSTGFDVGSVGEVSSYYAITVRWLNKSLPPTVLLSSACTGGRARYRCDVRGNPGRPIKRASTMNETRHARTYSDQHSAFSGGAAVLMDFSARVLRSAGSAARFVVNVCFYASRRMPLENGWGRNVRWSRRIRAPLVSDFEYIGWSDVTRSQYDLCRLWVKMR